MKIILDNEEGTTEIYHSWKDACERLARLEGYEVREVNK